MANGGNLKDKIIEMNALGLSAGEAYLLGKNDYEEELKDKKRQRAEEKKALNKRAVVKVSILFIIIVLIAFCIVFVLSNPIYTKILTILEIVLITLLAWFLGNHKEYFGDKAIPLLGIIIAIFYSLDAFTLDEAKGSVKEKLGIKSEIKLKATDSLKIYESIKAQKEK